MDLLFKKWIFQLPVSTQEIRSRNQLDPNHAIFPVSWRKKSLSKL